ncbi:hypothetical protein EJ06DRAFT_567676 [Trichodelitschia bisporula]|uniref:Uncharacterized protein n=1 Tax=Trichodelitschia bisporula TaxID=703511 RepID=A0A6G1HM83_9PEZI|nr:hypothetical protein EJ06DRAFT_567676 [Trichodelitschia bisporula]
MTYGSISDSAGTIPPAAVALHIRNQRKAGSAAADPVASAQIPTAAAALCVGHLYTRTAITASLPRGSIVRLVRIQATRWVPTKRVIDGAGGCMLERRKGESRGAGRFSGRSRGAMDDVEKLLRQGVEARRNLSAAWKLWRLRFDGLLTGALLSAL